MSKHHEMFGIEWFEDFNSGVNFWQILLANLVMQSMPEIKN